MFTSLWICELKWLKVKNRVSPIWRRRKKEETSTPSSFIFSRAKVQVASVILYQSPSSPDFMINLTRTCILSSRTQIQFTFFPKFNCFFSVLPLFKSRRLEIWESSLTDHSLCHLNFWLIFFTSHFSFIVLCFPWITVSLGPPPFCLCMPNVHLISLTSPSLDYNPNQFPCFLGGGHFFLFKSLQQQYLPVEWDQFMFTYCDNPMSIYVHRAL